jgi:hypothetical protein
MPTEVTGCCRKCVMTKNYTVEQFLIGPKGFVKDQDCIDDCFGGLKN